MIDFSVRSKQKELLDRDDIPFDDIKLNMRELNFINTYLGGHSITTAGLSKIIESKQSPARLLHICEIGCGGGDNLRAIRRWAEKKQLRCKLTGIDINPHCIAFARERQPSGEINYITSDYREARFDQKPDVIFSSLFCHHFNDEELVDMLMWLRSNVQQGFFINDLHRHPLAYYSIKSLTRLFSKSYLVKNDAPVSVLRGFTHAEWKSLFRRAGIDEYMIQWKWAFRWLIMVRVK